MKLPIIKDDNDNFMLLQTRWASEINPVLQNPVNSASILKNISLVNGTTIINHLLGAKLQGWKMIRQRAPASVYDRQDFNQTPQLTLVLVSDADVVVDLEVF